MKNIGVAQIFPFVDIPCDFRTMADRGMTTSQQISDSVNSAMPKLASHLKDWVQAHLTMPRRITLATDHDGLECAEFWLVTDHIGVNDSSYRIVCDDSMGMFGIECTLESGAHWMMGISGDFVKAVEGMKNRKSRNYQQRLLQSHSKMGRVN
jgi:hypothetical protein